MAFRTKQTAAAVAKLTAGYLPVNANYRFNGRRRSAPHFRRCHRGFGMRAAP
jgi:hypothetical protein